MKQISYDIVVIGGGPAGMAAAIAAKKAGVDRVVVLEQQSFLGGVLPQCIHDGFGLHILGQNLTGPEYAAYYRKLFHDLKIETHVSTTVMSINADHEVTCVGETLGAVTIKAKAVILAMGCKERSRGVLRIPGTRPAGIYTAGAAQYMMNIQNYLPGRSVVILGLGDIGLIMARRLTLEGAAVKLILGLEANGLQRNMIQCIRDFNIPLLQGFTVIKIHGVQRLKGVTIAERNPDGGMRQGSERYIPCNTLLLAAGLLPETEIAKNAGVELDIISGAIQTNSGRQTSVSGIFACGNIAGVHDLVDFVTLEGEQAGMEAAAYVKNENGDGTFNPAGRKKKTPHKNVEKKGAPDLPADTETIKYRICILCPVGCLMKAEFDGEWSNTGCQCDKGKAYGLQEILDPQRTLTTTVRNEFRAGGDGCVLLPVRTDRAVPMEKMNTIIKCCRKIRIDGPIEPGSILISNVAGTSANVIACDGLR